MCPCARSTLTKRTSVRKDAPAKPEENVGVIGLMNPCQLFLRDLPDVRQRIFAMPNSPVK
jgi:hypothetical protein